MKLHALSDLHIEYEHFVPPATDADAVVLAGDIGVGLGGLSWAASCFDDARPVVYVPGNHEYYMHGIDLLDELVALAPDNIHVLNNAELVLGDVRILGATLWTDFRAFGEAERGFCMAHAARLMNDFEHIRYAGRTFSPANSIALHKQSREWLVSRLDEEFDGSTVVVTHHLPSLKSVPEVFAASALTPAFASDLEPLMGRDRVALWIHGHTHVARDYEVDGTRVLCNPRGYPRERSWTGFRGDLVVEL